MNKTTTFDSLHDVEMRKEQLLREIRKDSKQMNNMSHQLFTPSEPLRGKRGNLRLQGLFNIGTNVFDGLFLAWKLYRKLKR